MGSCGCLRLSALSPEPATDTMRQALPACDFGLTCPRSPSAGTNFSRGGRPSQRGTTPRPPTSPTPSATGGFPSNTLRRCRTSPWHSSRRALLFLPTSTPPAAPPPAGGTTAAARYALVPNRLNPSLPRLHLLMHRNAPAGGPAAHAGRSASRCGAGTVRLAS